MLNCGLRDCYMLNLEPLELPIIKWLDRNMPSANSFFDYGGVLPAALEVVFGMTSRLEFKELDLLGISAWGMTSSMQHEFRELILKGLEDMCLLTVGERVHHGAHAYKLKNRYRLIISEIEGL